MKIIIGKTNQACKLPTNGNPHVCGTHSTSHTHTHTHAHTKNTPTTTVSQKLHSNAHFVRL